MTSAYEPGQIPEFDLGDRLKKAIEVSDLSVAAMAEYVGVTRETLSRYLNGRQDAPIAIIRLISIRTGVPFGWLQTGKTPADPDGPDGGIECPQQGSNLRPAD
ncbi:helix-turn-helix domain-containing protein [Gordonia sp. (in: high G+C Gram-positive bacteria)]|uniref:helix-turn-helix domain-containing protein n=1 Tax=Gordonia sp. (in: high G+C Gram-positive bacteria) TaxID=84139 RepID=UPI003C730122